MKCRKCGETLRRLTLQALMVDAGAKMGGETGWPVFCHDGKDHNFSATEEDKPLLVPEVTDGDIENER